jgi:hypothetical protein
LIRAGRLELSISRAACMISVAAESYASTKEQLCRQTNSSR